MTVDARGRIATHRRLPAAATVLVVLAALLWPVAAAASDTGTWTGLLAAVDGCAGTVEVPTTVVLAGDISEPGGTLTVGCVLDIDLAGHDLAVRDVVIGPGRQFTIMDSGGGGTLTADAADHSQVAGIRTTGAALVVRSGTVVATGGWHSAGVGGRLGEAGGSVTITGGTVTAYSMMHGAGIGGGQGAAGGPVSISGGTVTATGSGHAAGIGGGYEGAGGPVSISGGSVTATGIGQSAGIGGGINRAGGDVQVGAGAVVTATGGQTAIGAGAASLPFGSLAVAGTLHLPSGALHVPSGTVVGVADSGRILGRVDDPTSGASLTGAGRIANDGVVALTASRVTAGGVTVSGHHYRVSFEPDGGSPTPADVTVFASTFDAGHRDLPDAPVRDGHVFVGWTSQPDGAGDAVSAGAVLAGTSADGEPVGVVAHADWTVLTLDSGLPEPALTVVAGEHATFTPTVTDSDGQPFATDPLAWTVSDADGAVEATIDGTTGEVTLASTTAGAHTVELHIPVDGGSALTVTVTLHVEPAPATELHLDVAATTVTQGDTVTMFVTGSDAHGNPTGDITDEVTFTSDVATDLVDGNTITFPTASPHTVTATHSSGAVATLVFTITPTAAPDDPADPDDPVDADEPAGVDVPADLGDPAPSGPGAGWVGPPSAAPAASLPATGTDPVRLFLAALLSALAGSLLLHRDAHRRR